MTNSLTIDEPERLNRSLIARQAATAEILQTINASQGNLQPVFDVILLKAHRLCGADIGGLNIFDGAMFRAVATHGFPAQFDALVRQPRKPGRFDQRMLDGERFLHIVDIKQEETRQNDDQHLRGTIAQLDVRSSLRVPLRKDGTYLGNIVAYRLTVRPFSDDEITLLESFAAQAVIAMENARLLNELQARTDDLQQSLEYQTATSEVLKVISRSTFDLQPVLDTVVETAARLCCADVDSINLRTGDLWRQVANFGASAEYLAHARALGTWTMPVDGQTVTHRVVRERAIVHVEDAAILDGYREATLRLSGQRTTFGVPLLRDGDVIGVIILARRHVELFTQRQIDLVATFADQAVIAIENTRLLTELQARTAELAARNSDFAERIDQQSATIDVLKVMSASPDDTQPVFDQIVGRARELSSADAAALHEYDGTLVHYRAIRSPNVKSVAELAAFSPEGAAYAAMWPCPPTRGSISCRAILDREILHIRDFSTLTDIDPALRNVQTGAQLSVPLMRAGAAIGAISLMSYQPGGFTDSQIELLKTFAEQAVIAIGSVATYKALRQRTTELTQSVAAAEAALADLKRAQDRLVQSEKMASLGQLTAGIAHEIKNPLNFVNNFSDLSIELIDELQELLSPAPLADTTRAEVDDLTTLIKSNLGKVVQHGRRADSIVKNMLLHSRASGGDRRDVDLNATVEEALNLAYHGARAEKPGFNITMERNFDPAAGTVALYPQEFTRVLLNLFSNGFYATTKKSDQPGYDPVLTVTTEGQTDAVIIRIRDNGTGIPDSARARLFEPFFTTKPAGEGTGLGLSLSHDIIVKQHNGSIAVESVEGSHTEFTITIPCASTGTAP